MGALVFEHTSTGERNLGAPKQMAIQMIM